jgi:hypothetical protein
MDGRMNLIYGKPESDWFGVSKNERSSSLVHSSSYPCSFTSNYLMRLRIDPRMQNT